MLYQCKDCVFWTDVFHDEEDLADCVGVCRRRAPQAALVLDHELEDSAPYTFWPRTWGDDGCGEGARRDKPHG